MPRKKPKKLVEGPGRLKGTIRLSNFKIGKKNFHHVERTVIPKEKKYIYRFSTKYGTYSAVARNKSELIKELRKLHT